MRHPMLSLLLVLGLTLPALSAVAATGYVTDQLVLTLRSTAGNQYQTLGHLKTASKVEILGEEGKFLHVRSADGTEGYVLKQYITADLPKQLIIDRQNRELRQLRQKLQQLTAGSSQQQQTLADLQKQRDKLTRDLQQTRRQLQQLTEAHQQLLDASGNVLQITREKDQLKEENDRLAAEAARLEEENATLLTTGSIKWFLAGAGVLFFGWILGKISRKKRRSF
ncbi:TIGR04211 family SH3 domain-containing protein [Geothermobacter hydrogeniphilus]|uniref:SH3b domain-containing protein n=1 Tax=Geothermobacter hydrogeniphilus TaxID=1969733 RepID=A0A1X0YAP3_9BACT|nr:TIGR04211 family SH3 domain-containing protein [Geothermobacter hydrogeniphilus]ORJ62172.1 hypothetical protein B5V00_05340 [Geothermobacter hydrogeniphilus]